MLKITLGSPGSEKDGGVLLVQLRLSCWRGIVLEFADRLDRIASALPCRDAGRAGSKTAQAECGHGQNLSGKAVRCGP